MRINKLEVLQWAAITVAEIGIILFWIFGFNHNDKGAEISFLTAGFAAMVAVVCIGLNALRHRHNFYY